MEASRFHCAICGKQSNAFNYGINCCNACKMFYKRSIASPTFPKQCKNGGNCSNCRYCRFQRCLHLGMTIPGNHSIVEMPSLHNPDVSMIIQNLDRMNISRANTYLNYVYPENIGLDIFILSRTRSYIKKPANLKKNCHEWAAANINTSIDFVKKFDVIHEFSNDNEMLSFIKQSYFPIALLSNAWWSYSNHKEVAEFPGGVDFLSEEFKDFFKDCPGVMNKIICPLVAKIRDLKISALYDLTGFLRINGVFKN